jgi:quercetin dioxygenase-like cupin family protein
MSAFSNVNQVEVLKIWDGVRARAATGSQAALVHLVLDPDAVVPEHRHPHEQTGILLKGSLRFTVGGEAKDLKPGDMWVIPGGTPHDVVAGPGGATLVELFAPPREDWAGLERLPASPVTLP